MGKYIARRFLLMIPTLFGVTLVCFLILNLAPGSPVEQAISRIRFGGFHPSSAGVSDQVLQSLNKQYGFDKSVGERYLIWLKNVVTLDFGESFSANQSALSVIAEKLPVSLQFGIGSLFFIYLISIPLGIAKAVRDGSHFDLWTSVMLMLTYSIPPLVLGILLRFYLAGGQFLNILPLGELYSDSYSTLSFFGKIGDRVQHFILPLTCYVINGFAVLAFLMKNSLLEEIRLDYVRTARAKGLDEKVVIYRHALRNALVPIVTGIGEFMAIFFAGSIVIEEIFNLDGMGLLGYKATLARDYNVLMALIFFEALLAMIGRLISDVAYVYLDPRVDFK